MNGRGSAISGQYVYVLDQEEQASYLKVFNIGLPLQPYLVSSLRLLGPPRDLVVIPQYGYKLNAETPAVRLEPVSRQ